MSRLYANREVGVTKHAAERFRERFVNWVTLNQAKRLIAVAVREARMPTRAERRYLKVHHNFRQHLERDPDDYCLFFIHDETRLVLVTVIYGESRYVVVTCFQLPDQQEMRRRIDERVRRHVAGRAWKNRKEEHG